MDFNKIFAAVLVAGIVAMLGGFISKQLVHPKKLEKDAFTIEAAEAVEGGAAGKPVGPEPILALLAAADATRGEKIAKACAACHSFTKGGPNGVGPNLWGIVGGQKQKVAGFAYSGSLAETGGNVWNYAELNKFLYKPKVYAKNTKMSYAGLKKPDDRAALLAWLRLQSGSPAALPSAGDIAAEAPVVEAVPAVDPAAAKVSPGSAAAH